MLSVNNWNNDSRDFFEVYAKTKNDQLLKRRFLKPTRKHPKLKIVIACVFGVCAIVAVVLFALFNYFFGNLQTNTNFEKSCESLGVATMEKIDKNIINIAVFGVDKRKDEKNGRSDACLIVCFDGIRKKIKLAAIMRDSRVKIDGHGFDKFCHAYSYGGAKLAIKTLNKNFKLDIHDYVTVNFAQMSKVVDAIGGLDVMLSRNEVNAVNGLLNSTPGFEQCARVRQFADSKKLVHLNGAQVLQYSRIRKIDSDVKRVERQQYVLNLIFDKLKKLEKVKYPELIKSLLGMVETSLSSVDILKLTPFLTKMKSGAIESCKIPNPEDTKHVHSSIINGTWYWGFDLDKYCAVLRKFIYEN